MGGLERKKSRRGGNAHKMRKNGEKSAESLIEMAVDHE